MRVRRPRRPRRFRPADSAQQIVGGFLLAGPFVVTEEVWTLADNMSLLQALLTVGTVFGIGYATLYKADTKRDSDDEQQIVGVPIRFISLMCVSFGSVTILALLFGAPETFLDSAESSGETFLDPALEFLGTTGIRGETVLDTFKAVSVGSIFSVVGAATADSVFSR